MELLNKENIEQVNESSSVACEDASRGRARTLPVYKDSVPAKRRPSPKPATGLRAPSPKPSTGLPRPMVATRLPLPGSVPVTSRSCESSTQSRRSPSPALLRSPPSPACIRRPMTTQSTSSLSGPVKANMTAQNTTFESGLRRPNSVGIPRRASSPGIPRRMASPSARSTSPSSSTSSQHPPSPTLSRHNITKVTQSKTQLKSFRNLAK